MDNPYSSRIQRWIESIETGVESAPAQQSDQRPDQRPSQHQSERPAKRVCYGLDAPYSSPPLTEVMDDSTPRARGPKRTAEYNDQTPRPIFPLPSRKKYKSTSPLKTASRSTLENLAKPFDTQGFPASHTLRLEQLPPDAIPLYKQLYKTVKHQQAIIPFELRDEMAREETEEKMFKLPDTTDGAYHRALTTYTSLCWILQKAAEALETESHEGTWNEQVHSRVLDLVFASTPLGTKSLAPRFKPPVTRQGVSVRYVKVDSVGIAPDSRPAMKTDAESDSISVSSISSVSTENTFGKDQTDSRLRRSDGKKVDYVLVMDLPKDSALQAQIIHAASRGTDVSRVNQCTYRPIDKSLIAVSIETKAYIPKNDPLPQLSMWTAAWQTRMYAHRSAIDRSRHLPSQAAMPRLLTLPLIQVVGHEWRLYFAQDLGNSVAVHGPMTIGSTDDVISGWVLLASLDAIKTWVEGTFQDAMRSWFILDGPPAPQEPSASQDPSASQESLV